MQRDYPTQVCVHPREVRSVDVRLPLLVMLAPGHAPVIFEGRVDLERLYKELGGMGLAE